MEEDINISNLLLDVIHTTAVQTGAALRCARQLAGDEEGRGVGKSESPFLSDADKRQAALLLPLLPCEAC
ncbi:hypothetical protein K0M31_019027 [Melipona bicolor]|uniref:Uncharacterized protein n=1 Tax=Melipona bicolor TaxID=60889 RepID=A0AA40KDK7_9HYME|nr:hypothetical protein K0M31_019027 [Melipona bicolor]